MSVELVQRYLNSGFRIVTWPQVGDIKGPTTPGWPERTYTIEDYRPGYRVGLITGTELSQGHFLCDIDIDWAEGSTIAQRLLPLSDFVFGRASKRLSHCMYTTTEPVTSVRYEDIDGTCLIELRGTKSSGELGLQTMAPPSVWTKGDKTEPLVFIKDQAPTHYETKLVKQAVCTAAISMLLARHFGRNGFGHEVRLAWTGFLLRLGFSVEEIIRMGEAISIYTNNLEVTDVRRTAESTATRLADPRQKIKGGPALARIIGQHGKAVISRINEWIGRESDFLRNDGIIVRDNQHNIRRAVELLGKDLSFDAFGARMLIDGQRIEDHLLNDLWLRMDEEFHLRPTFVFFEKVIHKIARDNEFHPVKDYLNGLQWDNTPRIDTWLIQSAGAEDSPYIRAVSSIALIAAVRRIHLPGVKYDEMLVLEGAQGLNKSSALRALCPKAEWFSDDLLLNTSSQRLIEATLGKWIIEAADLAGKRKAEIEQLKATLSRQVDGPARMAYAREPVERPRQFILVGTTNSPAYLTDPTGARRFWPVAIRVFDVEWIQAHRDQLWAEAKHREALGESIRLHSDLWSVAGEHQEKRREIDPWEQTLRTFLLSVEPSGDGKRRVATDALWDALSILLDRRDRMGAIRIAEIMHRFGFKRTTVRVGMDVQTGYLTDQLGLLEIRDDESTDMRKDRVSFISKELH